VFLQSVVVLASGSLLGKEFCARIREAGIDWDLIRTFDPAHLIHTPTRRARVTRARDE